MARRHRLGSPPSDHDRWGYHADVSARGHAIDSAKAVDKGDCKEGFKMLLAARGSSAAAVAHVQSGGRDYGLNTAIETVERAEKHFAARCLRRR